VQQIGSMRLQERSVSLADLLSLTKPRLSSLVLVTTAGGMWLAPGECSLTRWIGTMVATAGTVGAANALNCYLERDSDRFMRRTESRPLPAGRMDPSFALAFGLLLAGTSIPALAWFANPLTALLGLLALLSYVLVYTPLKAKTSYAMLVGAFPGALPPLMGWSAVRGHLEAPGLVLFSILFFWQLPHFIAIALFRKEEYVAAGLHSVPQAQGEASARAQAVGYTALLVAVSVMLYPLRAAGSFYLMSALFLGFGFLAHGLWGWLRKLGPGWARQFFFLSLLYLAGLFVALLVDGAARG
jgi:protoheme IX farnesyltransferase